MQIFHDALAGWPVSDPSNSETGAYPLAVRGALGDGIYGQPYADALSQRSFNTARPQPQLYTVGKGDTVSGIAGGDYARMANIAMANNLQRAANGSPRLKAGQLLVIPDSSGLDTTTQRRLDAAGRNMVAANTQAMARQRATQTNTQDPFLEHLNLNGPQGDTVWNSWGMPDGFGGRSFSPIPRKAGIHASGQPFQSMTKPPQFNRPVADYYTDRHGNGYFIQNDASGSRLVPDDRDQQYWQRAWDEVGKAEGAGADGEPGMGSAGSILYSYSKLFHVPQDVADLMGDFGKAMDGLGTPFGDVGLSKAEPGHVEEEAWTRPAGWRLPVARGQWKGETGDSDWISYNDKVNAITGNRPIPFRRGYPDFSQWAKRSYRFDDLNGSSSDFDKVYDAYAKENGLNGRSAAKQMLSNLKLTPHHVHDGVTIELIPWDLHGQIPHLGGAFGLRQEGWND